MKRTLKLHLQYCWWKYLLALVASVLGISMIFDMTAYRSPEDKKTDLYILTGACDTEGLQACLWPMLNERCPEQEELTVVGINLVNEDMYSRMQYSTYVAARQGDVMLMPLQEVRALVREEGAWEVFDDLTPYQASGIINTEGMDLTAGMLPGEDGTLHLYGIPASTLTGLYQFYVDPADTLLVSMGYGGNLETAAHLIGLMTEKFQASQEAGE